MRGMRGLLWVAAVLAMSCSSSDGTSSESCGTVPQGEACATSESCGCELTCLEGVCAYVFGSSEDPARIEEGSPSGPEETPAVGAAAAVCETIAALPCSGGVGANCSQDLGQLQGELAGSECMGDFDGLVACLAENIPICEDGEATFEAALIQVFRETCGNFQDRIETCGVDACGSGAMGCSGSGDIDRREPGCQVSVEETCETGASAECVLSEEGGAWQRYTCTCDNLTQHPGLIFEAYATDCCSISTYLAAACGSVAGGGSPAGGDSGPDGGNSGSPFEPEDGPEDGPENGPENGPEDGPE